MMKQGYSNLVSAAASKAAYGFVIGMMVMVFSVHAQEETTQPVASEVIGIVDMKGILQRSIAIASIRKTLDEQGAIFQSEISVEETALREAEKNLNEDKANISEDEFKKRLADFEGRGYQSATINSGTKSQFLIALTHKHRKNWKKNC